MKLPFTDKFLWKVYSALEIGEEFLDSLIFTRKKLYFPAIDRLEKLYEKEKRKRKFLQFLNYLKKKGYIEIETLREKNAVLLTSKGLEKIFEISLKLKRKKKRSDEKWIMLMFDIPENKKHLRDKLRRYILSLGYKMLQKSVWVCPFDVLKETKDILRLKSLDPYARIFLIEKVV